MIRITVGRYEVTFRGCFIQPEPSLLSVSGSSFNFSLIIREFKCKNSSIKHLSKLRKEKKKQKRNYCIYKRVKNFLNRSKKFKNDVLWNRSRFREKNPGAGAAPKGDGSETLGLGIPEMCENLLVSV